MKTTWMILAAWGMLTVVSCAPRPGDPSPGPGSPVNAPQTQEALAPQWLPLEAIEPAPKLPEASPQASTRPAPLDAIEWYAQARAALDASPPQRQTAIKLLEKAVALDPQSAELHGDLARAYGSQDKAIAAFQKAIELDPEHLDFHEQLGRVLLLKGRLDEALRQFRLATQTTEYKEDEAEAAIIDFFLARVLVQKGYKRAAIDAYERLIGRMNKPSVLYRASPELMGLQHQPELIYEPMGELYTSCKQYGDAVKAYAVAAQRSPLNFDLQKRLINAMIRAGQDQAAADRAAEMITLFRANAASLELLRETYRTLGRESAMADAMLKVHRQDPTNRSILFALADVLERAGRLEEARKVLREAALLSRPNSDIVRRLFDLHDKRDDVEGGVRLLVWALAHDPDSLRDLSVMWGELLKPSRRNRLRLPLLQKLEVEPALEASRLFWVARIAEIWNRDALARSSMERGVGLGTVFPPLYRAMISDYWMRPDWDEKQKLEHCQSLVERARKVDAAFAVELEGRVLLQQRSRAAEAAEKLSQSIVMGNKSIDAQLLEARALEAAGQGQRAESLLWRMIDSRSALEDAYWQLFNYYLSKSDARSAVMTLGKWVDADPGNIRARVLRADLMRRISRPDAAEAEFKQLLAENPGDSDVLGAALRFYTDSGRIERYIAILEEMRQKQPERREAVEQLVMIYHDLKRPNDALRVLDAAQKAVATDPDLLYYVAHLYGAVDRKQTEEQLLEVVVKLDPKNAPACNDLGYTWVEAGKSLDRAEQLIRVAVEGEPDNQSFLDSLGWVLYKRSKFAEALVYFDRAIGPAARPDPVVLDHMGDVLYKLGRLDEAVKRWKWASQRLDEIVSSREDLKELRKTLTQKLKQHEQGKPVDVAPVAGKKD